MTDRSFEVVGDDWRAAVTGRERFWSATLCSPDGNQVVVRRAGAAAELSIFGAASSKPGISLSYSIPVEEAEQLLAAAADISIAGTSHFVTATGLKWRIDEFFSPADHPLVATAGIAAVPSAPLPAWVGAERAASPRPAVGSYTADRVSAWQRFLAFSGRIEAVAKPVALTLGVLGLLAIYFPQGQRIWEEWTMPSSWYQVGTIKKDPDNRSMIFDPGSYTSPAWKEGLRADVLFDLVGKNVATTEVAYGRADTSTTARLETVLEKNKCLYVRELRFSPMTPGGDAGPAAGATEQSGEAASPRLERVTGLSMGGAEANCQPLTESEWAKAHEKKASAAGVGSTPANTAIPAYNSKVAVCRRTLVWVRAKRVSC